MTVGSYEQKWLLARKSEGHLQVDLPLFQAYGLHIFTSLREDHAGHAGARQDLRTPTRRTRVSYTSIARGSTLARFPFRPSKRRVVLFSIRTHDGVDQSSTVKPGTRDIWSRFALTRTAPLASACAAIAMSKSSIRCPLRSSVALITPKHSLTSSDQIDRTSTDRTNSKRARMSSLRLDCGSRSIP